MNDAIRDDTPSSGTRAGVRRFRRRRPLRWIKDLRERDVIAAMRDCCGCSCDVCKYGHSQGFHSLACSDRATGALGPEVCTLQGSTPQGGICPACGSVRTPDGWCSTCFQRRLPKWDDPDEMVGLR